MHTSRGASKRNQRTPVDFRRAGRLGAVPLLISSSFSAPPSTDWTLLTPFGGLSGVSTSRSHTRGLAGVLFLQDSRQLDEGASNGTTRTRQSPSHSPFPPLCSFCFSRSRVTCFGFLTLAQQNVPRRLRARPKFRCRSLPVGKGGRARLSTVKGAKERRMKYLAACCRCLCCLSEGKRTKKQQHKTTKKIQDSDCSNCFLFGRSTTLWEGKHGHQTHLLDFYCSV